MENDVEVMVKVGCAQSSETSTANTTQLMKNNILQVTLATISILSQNS